MPCHPISSKAGLALDTGIRNMKNIEDCGKEDGKIAGRSRCDAELLFDKEGGCGNNAMDKSAVVR